MSKQDKFLKGLSARINKLRLEKELSYQQFADACEMEKSRVYEICTQDRDIKASTILKIATGLDITVTELLDFKY